MKTKFIALALAAITLCMALTGCMHTDIGIKMNKDETGSISATFGIEKDFYEEIKASGDDPFEGKTTVTYELGNETYIGYTETKEYGSYADMEKALLEMTYQTDMLDEMNDEEDAEPDDSEYTLYTPVEEKEDNHIFSAVEIEKNGGIFYSSYTFHATLNPQTGDYNGTAFKDIFKVTISLEMPEKISQSQGGTVDGNKITFDVTDVSEGGELAAFCDANNTGLIVGIIAVFVVLAVIGAIVAKKHQQ